MNIKQKMNNDPELFIDAPLLIIALNFMTIGGYLIFEQNFQQGFVLLVFASVIVVLEKFLEKKRK